MGCSNSDGSAKQSSSASSALHVRQRYTAVLLQAASHSALQRWIKNSNPFVFLQLLAHACQALLKQGAVRYRCGALYCLKGLSHCVTLGLKYL